MVPFPIDVAERIARRRNWDAILIFGRSGEAETVTTWGRRPTDKVRVAEVADDLKNYVLGWEADGTTVHSDFRTETAE